MRQTTAALLLLGLVVLAWLLMWRGWRRRARRDADLAPLPDVPDDLGAVRWGPQDATYVSTTAEGDWLDRVVARGLGARSAAEVTVAARGVLVRRRGAPDLFVPAERVSGARREPGQAGKFVGRDGLVVLSWDLDGRPLQTGLRLRRTGEQEALVQVLTTSEETA